MNWRWKCKICTSTTKRSYDIDSLLTEEDAKLSEQLRDFRAHLTLVPGTLQPLVEAVAYVEILLDIPKLAALNLGLLCMNDSIL